MNMLRTTPVIQGERQIGYFQGICFDQARKRVRAFVISSGMYGKRIVEAQHIQMITDKFILVNGWSKYSRTDKQQTSLFVRDTSGLLVGRVTDYAIDETTLEVMAIEIVSGYLPRETRIRDWIYTYVFSENSGELCIPVILRSQQHFCREGFEACGYPP